MKTILTAILYSLFTLLGLPVASVGQNYILSGVVTDQESNAHLASVKILVNNTNGITLTDINGLFTVRANEPIHRLQFTQSGYQSLSLDVTDKASPLVIKLIPTRYPFDSLSARQSDTYHYIDSILHKEQDDQLLRRQKSLLSGQVEVGWFSLDLNRMKRYNQFEGVYLGLGGYTNKRLFRSVSLGGFAGYGFKDQKSKYGFEISAFPDKKQHFTLDAGYRYDTRESMGSRFFDEKNGAIDPSTFRFFYVKKMDYEQKLSFSVSLHQNDVNYYVALQQRIIDRGYDISNGVKVLLPEKYNVSGLIAGIRLAPGEKSEQVTDKTDSKCTLFPVIWFQITRGIPDLLKGDFNFNRYQGKIQYAKQVGQLGWSSLQVIGNLLEGQAPYFEYFNGGGSYGNFGLFASGSFVTMHPDEFMNDKSIGLFFTHYLGNIFPRSQIFHPSPALVFNYGWGKLQKDPPGYFLPAMDMSFGFVETGVQVNNLLDLKVYGLGLGAYYRMGAYSYSTVKENLVFKIVVSFPGQH